MADHKRSKYLDVQNEQKNRYTFLGILQGVTCDGHVTLKEIDYILNWLDNHSEGISDIPQIEKIESILNDFKDKQTINYAEEDKLKEILNGLSGSQWEQNQSSTNMPINLYNSNPSIVFSGSIFVFTGKFEYGRKNLCEELVLELDGDYEERVTMDTDYLVVGKHGSKDWTHNSWGTKITRANELNIMIISEDQWLNASKKQ